MQGTSVNESTLRSKTQSGRRDAFKPSTSAADIRPPGSAASSKEKGVASTTLETAGKLPNGEVPGNVKEDPSPSTKGTARSDETTRDLLRVKITAWQEARADEITNRYKGEETKIQAWEDRQKAKASIILTREEIILERRRAKLTANMVSEVERTHRKAQELKQAAYAKKDLELDQLNAEAETLKETGRISNGCFY
ncbi:hypothetical protein O6H91_22G027000 [Diphasiastrum complanatum]|uniref:Uncharacterized protein n=1 Tax=Diphasiastrum complanatum TaxID=34168 RepID=A0ACC2AE98_DIPCM|nr:hypothetical protein O6H91_22G027000 [Diphasiastrum complanatum]